MSLTKDLYCGTAGWQIPGTLEHAPKAGSHLERYSRLFNAVEINSVFYRPHKTSTFERWAASVPDEFRFAVKMHRSITHEIRLRDIKPAQDFLDMVGALGEKLGPVLIQLPPSLAWSMEAEEFLSSLREVFSGPVVLEARHRSWSAPEVNKVLRQMVISGVAADPPRIQETMAPTGHPGLSYFRLHGSPKVYWSAYTDEFLHVLAQEITGTRDRGRSAWVIFDNTAAGAAARDAMRLRAMMEGAADTNA